MKNACELNLILLAAGCGQRFGSNKLLFELEGQPLWRRMLDKLLTAALSPDMDADTRIFVVTQYKEILIRTEQLSYTGSAGLVPLQAVYSPGSAEGISHTIHAGLDAALKKSEKAAPPASFSHDSTRRKKLYFFFVADQPYLTAQSILTFLRAASASGKSLGCVCHENTPGNPAFFDETLLPELYALTGDHGGRKVLHSHWENCFLYPLSDPNELADVDNPDFFKKSCGKACARTMKPVE